MLPHLVGMACEKSNIGGWLFAKACWAQGITSFKQCRGTVGRLKYDIGISPRTFEAAKTMSANDFVASMGKYNNGNKGVLKCPKDIVRAILEGCAQPSCRFQVWKEGDYERPDDGSDLVPTSVLNDAKLGLYNKSNIENTHGVTRSTWCTWCKHDHRDMQRSSRRQDVCPVEGRFDRWMVPHCMEPIYKPCRPW